MPTADALAACQHYQSAGGCILVLDTGLTQGMKSVRGPLQLSGAFFAFDYFQRNSDANSALLAHIATQDLLQSFFRASAILRPGLPSVASQTAKLKTTASHPETALQTRPGVRVLPVVLLNQKPEVLIVDDSRVGAIDKIRGSLAGCDAYLTKPLNPSQLSELLSSLALVANVRRAEERHTPLRAVGSTGAANF